MKAIHNLSYVMFQHRTIVYLLLGVLLCEYMIEIEYFELSVQAMYKFSIKCNLDPLARHL